MMEGLGCWPRGEGRRLKTLLYTLVVWGQMVSSSEISFFVSQSSCEDIALLTSSEQDQLQDIIVTMSHVGITGFTCSRRSNLPHFDRGPSTSRKQ